jgi:hypothetical protein
VQKTLPGVDYIILGGGQVFRGYAVMSLGAFCNFQHQLDPKAHCGFAGVGS